MGEISISKEHPWSNGLNSIQISPYLQELQVYAGQSDNYEAATDTLEKYLRITISSSQVKRVTNCYSEALKSSDYNLQVAQEEKVASLKRDIEPTETVYGMVDGGMIQTREGEKSNDWKGLERGKIRTNI